MLLYEKIDWIIGHFTCIHYRMITDADINLNDQENDFSIDEDTNDFYVDEDTYDSYSDEDTYDLSAEMPRNFDIDWIWCFDFWNYSK